MNPADRITISIAMTYGDTLADLYAHMEWADVSGWKSIASTDALLSDGTARALNKADRAAFPAV